MISYSLIENNKDTQPVNKNSTYKDFLADITKTEVVPKSDRSAFLPCVFNGTRLTENITHITMLILDIDKAERLSDDELILLLSDIKHVSYVYPTSSHTPTSPRYRGIIFLEKEIEVANYKTAATNFINTLDPILRNTLDITSSTTPNKLFYNYHTSDGDLIDLSILTTPLNLHSYAITEESTPISYLETLVNNTPLKIDDMEVLSILDSYPAENLTRDEWIRVGMALHHQYEGKKKGIDIFNDWSSKDGREGQYKGLEDIKKIYKSFKTNKTRPITLASIKFLVKKPNDIIYDATNGLSNHLKNRTYQKINSRDFPSVYIDSVSKSGVEKLHVPTSLDNVEYMLNRYNIKIYFDEIMKTNLFYYDGKITKNNNLIAAEITSALEVNKFNTKHLHSYINKISEGNTCNTFREAVTSQTTSTNLTELLATIEVEKEYEDIKNRWIKLWLYELVKITCFNDDLNTQVNARFVLVLQGAERKNKTYWFSTLIPIEKRRDFFINAQTLDTSNDMSKLKCLEKVICELGELGSTFRKSDKDSLKNFISSTSDTLNIKYVAAPITYKRTTIFCATLNDLLFLDNESQNTRFLVIPILNCNSRHNINMWEVYNHIYNDIKENGFLEFTEDDYKLLSKTNKDFELECPLTDQFNIHFNIESKEYIKEYNCSEILVALGYNKEFILKNRKMLSTIKLICTKLGLPFIKNIKKFKLPPERGPFDNN